MKLYRWLLLLLVCACVVEGVAQTAAISTRIVASNLRAPWEIVWGPDNKLWMTELRGGISTIDPTTGEKRILLDSMPDASKFVEGGLLGMVLHPVFSENPFVYVAYTYFTDRVYVKIVRYRYDGSTLVEPTIILGGIKGAAVHNGCRLVFGPDGMLYITTGDAATGSDAQNLAMLNGKVLRIAPDGSIPSDNPQPASPVWTWGHRNAQGLDFSPSGKLYSSEHGASTDDEVNLIMKGRNYGWPSVEGMCDLPLETAFCNDSNVAEPIGPPYTPTLALGDLAYYASDLIPEWKDHILMTAMKQEGTLVVLALSEDHSRVVGEERYFKGVYGRLRAVCVAPDGRVFFGSSNYDNYGAQGVGYPGSDWIIEITPLADDVHDDDAGELHATFEMHGLHLRATTTAVRARLVIMDVLGRAVSVHDAISAHFEVDTSTLPPGAYLATMHAAGTAKAYTFVR